MYYVMESIQQQSTVSYSDTRLGTRLHDHEDEVTNKPQQDAPVQVRQEAYIGTHFVLLTYQVRSNKEYKSKKLEKFTNKKDFRQGSQACMGRGRNTTGRGRIARVH